MQNINTLGAECLFCNEEIFLFTSAGFTTYITDLHRHISNFFCNSKECIVSGACNILLKSLYSTDIAKHTLLKHLPMYVQHYSYFSTWCKKSVLKKLWTCFCWILRPVMSIFFSLIWLVKKCHKDQLFFCVENDYYSWFLKLFIFFILTRRLGNWIKGRFM